jgi:hypothetical protein
MVSHREVFLETTGYRLKAFVEGESASMSRGRSYDDLGNEFRLRRPSRSSNS